MTGETPEVRFDTDKKKPKKTDKAIDIMDRIYKTREKERKIEKRREEKK